MFNYKFSKPVPDNRTSDLTTGEFLLLMDYVLNNKINSYLEIGVWHGVNVFRIANLCEVNNHECEIVGYDCFEEDPEDDNSHRSGWPAKEIAEKVTADYNNVSLVQGFVNEVNDKLENKKFDLVFHDANHAFQAVYDDLLTVKNLVKEGGLVVAHNSEADNVQLNYGAKSAIDKLIAEGHYKFHSRVDRSTAITPCQNLS
jgi:predicted O-methyltransferase YrrM